MLLGQAFPEIVPRLLQSGQRSENGWCNILFVISDIDLAEGRPSLSLRSPFAIKAERRKQGPAEMIVTRLVKQWNCSLPTVSQI
jgi:hypothetical protein